MTSLICFIIVILFFNMLLMVTPLIALLNILAISLMLSYMVSILFSNWFSYMIFLIYVGGMLVIFSYFVALAPNQLARLNMVVTILFVSLLILVWLTNNNMDPYMHKYMSSFYMMYLESYYSVLILLILFLLLMMLVVVKLVSSSKGPLRPFK
nr:NADH dehydrogenase subunit 6 [Hirudo nipponia]